MRPVLTVEQMRQVDADALEHVSESVLVERAGTAVATAALKMMGGAYGRRVVVVAGKGNNGADGRVAASRLQRRGARVTVMDPSGAPERLGGGRPGAGQALDLVVDAAYGTGFRGSYEAPSVPPGVKVLAVDIPSGVDGNTGQVSGAALRADVTVTFAALKQGLLQGDGPALCGEIEVADIGLDTTSARTWLVEDRDVRHLLPRRPREAHKWQAAVVIVAGSPGMTGAASLCARACYRSGAGMVRLAVPGARGSELPSTEAVAFEVPEHGWARNVMEVAQRAKVIVIGPGLGRDPETRADVRTVAESSPVPVVVDADGLFALGNVDDVAEVTGARATRVDTSGSSPIVLTPHSGEYARIFGAPPGVDHIGETIDSARRAGCVLLLKGPTTVVAGPGGSDAHVVTSGGPSLATAGTGDVLSGAIGAFIARGVGPSVAAALAAHAHGRAASMGPREGLVAGDVAEFLGLWLSSELHPGTMWEGIASRVGSPSDRDRRG